MSHAKAAHRRCSPCGDDRPLHSPAASFRRSRGAADGEERWSAGAGSSALSGALGRTADNQLIVAVAQASAASDPRVAIAPLEQAIAAARPRDAQPYIVLADAYRQSGRIDDAIRAYRDAAARNPGTENAYAAQAELLLAKGQIDDAQRLVESAMRMFPEAVDLPNTLSGMYGRRQRFDDAMRVLTKAAQANPDHPLTWLNLGVCLQAKGEYSRAEAAYRKALQLQPDFEKARLYLSRLKNKL